MNRFKAKPQSQSGMSVETVNRMWTQCKQTQKPSVCNEAFNAFFYFAKENPRMNLNPKFENTGVMDMWYVAQGIRDVQADGLSGVISSMQKNIKEFK